jgi:hypothetical protein
VTFEESPGGGTPRVVSIIVTPYGTEAALGREDWLEYTFSGRWILVEALTDRECFDRLLPETIPPQWVWTRENTSIDRMERMLDECRVALLLILKRDTK